MPAGVSFPPQRLPTEDFTWDLLMVVPLVGCCQRHGLPGTFDLAWRCFRIHDSDQLLIDQSGQAFVRSQGFLRSQGMLPNSWDTMTS